MCVSSDRPFFFKIGLASIVGAIGFAIAMTYIIPGKFYDEATVIFQGIGALGATIGFIMSVVNFPKIRIKTGE
jgi:hypothetical protein